MNKVTGKPSASSKASQYSDSHNKHSSPLHGVHTIHTLSWLTYLSETDRRSSTEEPITRSPWFNLDQLPPLQPELSLQSAFWADNARQWPAYPANTLFTYLKVWHLMLLDPWHKDITKAPRGKAEAHEGSDWSNHAVAKPTCIQFTCRWLVPESSLIQRSSHASGSKHERWSNSMQGTLAAKDATDIRSSIIFLHQLATSLMHATKQPADNLSHHLTRSLHWTGQSLCSCSAQPAASRAGRLNGSKVQTVSCTWCSWLRLVALNTAHKRVANWV